MSKQKKPYVKPKMKVVPAGSSKYNEIMALLKTEDFEAKQRESIPPPAKSR